jgi:plastocyanin
MKKNHYWGLAASIITTMIFGISCSKSNGSYGNTNTNPSGSGTGNTISIYGMAYSPASKTVAKGTVVKWVNDDNYAHTVTSDDGTTFDSGNIAAGKSYSYTASTPGTFNYHCTIHGTSMAGTLVVSP